SECCFRGFIARSSCGCRHQSHSFSQSALPNTSTRRILCSVILSLKKSKAVQSVQRCSYPYWACLCSNSHGFCDSSTLFLLLFDKGIQIIVVLSFFFRNNL